MQRKNIQRWAIKTSNETFKSFTFLLNMTYTICLYKNEEDSPCNEFINSNLLHPFTLRGCTALERVCEACAGA